MDFLQPERFHLEYTDSTGKAQKPFMVHRAPLGSRERIMAILIEHYMGAFPLWLSPVQVKILTIDESLIDYAKDVEKEIKSQAAEFDLNIRIEIDIRKENLQKKIADAAAMKIPYILVVGKREQEAGKVAVRVRGRSGNSIIESREFAEKLIKEIRNRDLELEI